MESPSPVGSVKEQPSQSEIFGRSHDSLESKYDSSSLDNDNELTPLFVSDLLNEQISCCEESFGDQTSMGYISDKAHFDDIPILPFPSSENVPVPESIGSESLAHELDSHTNNTEVAPVSVCVPVNQQISESEKSLRTEFSSQEKCDSSNVRSVLVSGTAMCLDLDDLKGQVRVIIEKNLEEHIPLAVSAPRRSPVKDELRTSKYHGVTRHFWTGKFEAHLWDSSYIREGQRRKGKQVFLGQYNIEEKAARAYDLAALKYWGPSAGTRLNFPISSYEKEVEEMNHMSREEFVMFIRRQSSFKIGSSVYRGVTRHGDGRWQARISGIPGKRGLHLGTFGSEEEAAKAYDIASIKFRGIKAFTNFDVSNYCQVDLKELEGQPEPKKSKKNLHLASSTIVVATSDPQQ